MLQLFIFINVARGVCNHVVNLILLALAANKFSEHIFCWKLKCKSRVQTVNVYVYL